MVQRPDLQPRIIGFLQTFAIATTVVLALSATAHAADLLAQVTPDAPWPQRLVEWLALPWVRWVFVVAFLQSLFLAITIPGKGTPEAVCVTSLAVLIVVPLMMGGTGTIFWLAILSVLVGIALIAFEVFVFPGHFVSVALGLLLLLGGLVVTLVPQQPGVELSSGAVLRSIWWVLAALVAVVTASALMMKFLPNVPIGRNLVLPGTVVSSPGPINYLPDLPALGSTGVAATDLRPGGIVEFPPAAPNDIAGPRRFSASAPGLYLLKGARVELVTVEGNTLIVREIIA